MSDELRDDDRFERVSDDGDEFSAGKIHTVAELRVMGYSPTPEVWRNEFIWKRLPREPVPATAPSLESQVPVGSRWRRNNDQFMIYSIVGPSIDGRIDCAFGAGRRGTTTAEWLHENATRIDEPTKTTKTTHSVVLPAMPPARCAPGCTPARSCRIIIPVTDKGTRYECPAFAEDAAASMMEFMGRANVPEKDCEGEERPPTPDQRKAREMRNQPWEPSSPMMGRYRFSRR